MENIELVIKIPEEKLSTIKNKMYCGIYDPDLYKAIETGTPLPKGHGELKDTDAMINKLCTPEASESFGSITCAEILDFINDEKPIIKADKAESEGNMTREEAIKMLKSKMDGHTDTSYEWAETVRMAINALDKCDKIEKIIDSNDADFIANYVRGLFAE